MVETPMQYKARIVALMEGKDPVAVQRATSGQLQQLVAGVPLGELRRRTGPEKWSAAGLLAHLAEAEITSTWRYRQMLEHDGCPLPGFGQELWAKLGNYSTRNPEESLLQFKLLRQTNLQMFDQLTPEQWDRRGVHLERGEMTVRDLAIQIAGHDLNHLTQIRSALKK